MVEDLDPLPAKSVQTVAASTFLMIVTSPEIRC